jgi:hypothetical protein
MNTAETIQQIWPLGWEQNLASDTAVAMLGQVRVECYTAPVEGVLRWHLVFCGPGCAHGRLPRLATGMGCSSS